MSWDYAEMSKAAKEMGGPEKYADSLVQSGRQEMIPCLILMVAGTFLVTKFGAKIKNFFKSKWVSKSEATVARKAIVEGINKYDEDHENVDCEENDEEERF